MTYEINANCGTEFDVTCMDANYDELPDPADPDDEYSVLELSGDLTNPDDLRKLASFLDACKTRPEVAIVTFDID